MRSSAWRRRSIVSAALLLSFGFVLDVTGCAHDTSTDMTMAPDKEKAIMAADAVISTGETEIKEGQDMQSRDADQSAKLIKQGEADKARGQALFDQASSMN